MAAEQEKPKTIFYSLSQALKNNKKDIPSELLKNSNLLTNDPNSEVNYIQQQQQRFADFQTLKVAQDLYSRSMYYDSDRISAYNDYRAMDQSPEISVALDIMSDECVTRNDRGEILTIYSEDSRIKRVLNDLFHGTLNINYNLWFWIRALLKYGDNFLKLELDQHLGVYNITQLPTGEIHKEIGYDGNPSSVRFKWDVNNMYFEDFQIAHFSLISDGEKMPYGRSVLDPVRKLWKQLQLAEDALLVYRLVRAPERRMFFIDVGNTDTADVRQYIEKMKAELKKSQVVDTSGRINMKFNLITFEEDFFIPVRGDKTGTRVETLPGACLSLDTKICLLDGRNLELKEIIKEFNSGKKLETYSINPKTGEIVPGIISWAGVTRKNTDVIKLILDNGNSIICTPDHKFPTRNRGIVLAKDLVKNDSLWSFSKDFKPIRQDKKNKRNDYEVVFDHSKNKWIFTHQMVANYFKNFNNIKELIFNQKYKEELRKTIHHINFDRFNNSSENLSFVNNKDHYEYHQYLIMEFSKAGTEAWLYKFNNDDKFKNNIINKLNKIRYEYYLNRNENQKQIHNTSIGLGLKKYFESLSEEEILKEMEPLFNAQIKARKRLNEKLQNKEFKKSIYDKVSIKSKITKNTVEYKEKCSKNSKKLWTNPSFYSKVIEKQKIKYSQKLFNIIRDLYLKGNDSKNILRLINEEKSDFNIEFNLLNNDNKQLLKMNQFTHNNLYKLVRNFGYKNWREFTNTVHLYNHKIVSIEFLEYKMDTGTITVDGNEQYHNFHNFALEVGVFTQNSNLGDIADVEYLQNKLFTGIKVPKTYLNYGEALPGGSTLSQADLRFARTINRFQEAIILELRNIANIHLKMLGFDDDINNFTLTLTNPSTQQELLKLETMKARLDVFKEMFSSDATAPVSYTWAMEFILGFSKSEIKQILRQKKIERKMFYEIERAHEEYMDTGIFTELDKKFRKPDFDPNTQIEGDQEGDGGGDAGGGGFGGFGGGSSFGLGDTDSAELDNLGGDIEDLEGGDTTAIDDAGATEPEPETDDTLKENILLNKNKVYDNKTKNLLEGVNSFLKKINKINESKK